MSYNILDFAPENVLKVGTIRYDGTKPENQQSDVVILSVCEDSMRKHTKPDATAKLTDYAIALSFPISFECRRLLRKNKKDMTPCDRDRLDTAGAYLIREGYVVPLVRFIEKHFEVRETWAQAHGYARLGDAEIRRLIFTYPKYGGTVSCGEVGKHMHFLCKHKNMNISLHVGPLPPAFATVTDVSDDDDDYA